MKVGIINVTGYAGMELARILHRHPDVEITTVTGRSQAGMRLGEVFPHLSQLDLPITEDLTDNADLVFSALPHGASAERVGSALADGLRVVDISADFRLRDVENYARWYNTEHPRPQYLEEAVYGLPELHRERIGGARLVANPGCHATAAVLALAPAVHAGIVGPDIVVDTKSGVSGAGRAKHYYSEVNESVTAYKIAAHFHQPEIEQELAGVGADLDLRLTFVPHLVPMTRGILATCYASIRDGAGLSSTSALTRVLELYRDFYDGHPFVEVVDTPPLTKHTLGSNMCVVHPTIDIRAGRLIVISCIDNLVKGAAGQAVQNMNLMAGLPEDEGLRHLALYP